MREIKFRVFSYLTKEFLKHDSKIWEDSEHKFSGLEFLGGDEIYITYYTNIFRSEYESFSFPLKKSEYAVSQFTGLKDCKGNEIFEGDIVANICDGEILMVGDIQFGCGVFGVEWVDCKKNKSMVGSWGQKHNLRRLDDDIIEKNKIEVIGNIYETPKLLKTKIGSTPYSLVKGDEEKWQNAIRKEYAKNKQLELRAWHKDLKLMEKVEKLYLNFGSCRTENYNENIKNFVLMRFTGLYDCNGTKIYEGDIVESGTKYNHSNFEVRFVASRNESGFCNDELGCFIGFDDISQDFKEECKVIGNVFQHPELLER